MSFYGITTESNGTSETAHAHTDDYRYDIVELCAAGATDGTSSGHLRVCSFGFRGATRVTSANELSWYHHRV